MTALIEAALTLTDKEYQIMRDASLAVLREIGVETGGSNAPGIAAAHLYAGDGCNLSRHFCGAR